METNDYASIASLAQLRAVRKALAADIAAYEGRFTLRIRNAASAFSLKNLLLPLLKKLRKTISGTPFAKS